MAGGDQSSGTSPPLIDCDGDKSFSPALVGGMEVVVSTETVINLA